MRGATTTESGPVADGRRDQRDGWFEARALTETGPTFWGRSAQTTLNYSVHVAAYSNYWHAFRVSADETTQVPGYGDIGTSIEANFEFGRNQEPDLEPRLIPEPALVHAFEVGSIGVAGVLATIALLPAGE